MRPILLVNSNAFLRPLYAIFLIFVFAASSTKAWPQSAPQSLDPQERRIVQFVDAHVSEDQALLQRIVDINSGTMNFAGVEAVKDIVLPRIAALGFKARWVPMQSVTGRAG